MKAYGVRNKGQKKLFCAVLTVLISIIVISSMTIVLGLYLKNKADGVEIGLSSIVGRNDINTENSDSKEPSVTIESKPSPDKKAVYFDLKKISDENFEAKEEINKIKESGFSAISISLIDKDGYMTYSSESLIGFVKQHVAEFVIQQSKLSDFISLAKESEIYTVAYYVPGNIYTDDQTELLYIKTLSDMISKDANMMKFDEIVISGIVPSDDISRENSELIVNYLESFSKNLENVKMSVAVLPETFKNVTLSPQVEYISSFVDYIALDLTAGKTGENTSWKDFLENLKEEIAGYFNIYNMRFLMSAEDEDLFSELSETLNTLECSNFQFIINPDFTKDDVPEPDVNNTSGNTDPNGGNNPAVPSDPVSPAEPEPPSVPNSPEPSNTSDSSAVSSSPEPSEPNLPSVPSEPDPPAGTSAPEPNNTGDQTPGGDTPNPTEPDIPINLPDPEPSV